MNFNIHDLINELAENGSIKQFAENIKAMDTKQFNDVMLKLVLAVGKEAKTAPQNEFEKHEVHINVLPPPDYDSEPEFDNGTA